MENSLKSTITSHNLTEEFLKFQANYKGVDKKLKAVVLHSLQKAYTKENDTVILVVGHTGSGKSTLGHHLHYLYSFGDMDINKVAFDKNTLAQAIKFSTNQEQYKDRIVHFDEATVSRRDSSSVFNKKLIHLYEVNREKRLFTIWCTPSAQYMERKFIEERINALIFVYERPRGKYILIPRLKLKEMIKDHGEIYELTLKQHGESYAIIKNGRFTKFDDEEWNKIYLKKKNDRIDYVTDDFFDEFNDQENCFSMRQVAEQLRISQSTVSKTIKGMIDNNLLSKEIMTPTGRYKINQENLDIIKKYIEVNK